jgi:hypothetical protein
MVLEADTCSTKDTVGKNKLKLIYILKFINIINEQKMKHGQWIHFDSS